MLQLQIIRQRPDWIKERLAIKNFSDSKLIDEIIALDDQRKKLQLDFDNTQAKVNSLSKEIGSLMAKGQKEEAEAKKKEVALFKEKLEPIKTELAKTEGQLD